MYRTQRHCDGNISLPLMASMMSLYRLMLLIFLIQSVDSTTNSSRNYEKGYNNQIPPLPLPPLPYPPPNPDAPADNVGVDSTETKMRTLIDIRFNTAIKCLLFGPPTPSQRLQSGKQPLDEDEVINSNINAQQLGAGGGEEEEEEPLFPTKLLGNNLNIYATGERRHETNYFGGLIRWHKKMTTTRRKQQQRPISTLTADISSEWTLHNPKELDSISLRLNLNNDDDVANGSKLVEARASYCNRLTQMGCRFPLLRRLHIWSILHIPWNSNSFHHPLFHNGPIKIDDEDTNKNNYEWYIPDITVDPFGMFTACNEYKVPLPLQQQRRRQAQQRGHFHQQQVHDRVGGSSNDSLLKFRLRISSRLSVLSNTVGMVDDDHHVSSSPILFLECSHIDRHQCMSTTGRLEAPLEISKDWKNSPVFTDSRFLIIHERLMNKQTNKQK